MRDTVVAFEEYSEELDERMMVMRKKISEIFSLNN